MLLLFGDKIVIPTSAHCGGLGRGKEKSSACLKELQMANCGDSQNNNTAGYQPSKSTAHCECCTLK